LPPHLRSDGAVGGAAMYKEYVQEAHSHGRAVHVAEHEAGVQMAAGPSIRTPAEAPSNKREVAQHVPTRGNQYSNDGSNKAAQQAALLAGIQEAPQAALLGGILDSTDAKGDAMPSGGPQQSGVDKASPGGVDKACSGGASRLGRPSQKVRALEMSSLSVQEQPDGPSDGADGSSDVESRLGADRIAGAAHMADLQFGAGQSTKQRGSASPPALGLSRPSSHSATPHFLTLTLKHQTKTSLCVTFEWPSDEAPEHGICLCMDNGQAGPIEPCAMWAQQDIMRRMSVQGKGFEHVITNLQPGQSYRLCTGALGGPDSLLEHPEHAAHISTFKTLGRVRAAKTYTKWTPRFEVEEPPTNFRAI